MSNDETTTATPTEIADGIHAGTIVVSAHVPAAILTCVFPGLALMGEAALGDMAACYGRVSEAGSMEISGFPMFPVLHLLNRTKWRAVCASYNAAAEAREASSS